MTYVPTSVYEGWEASLLYHAEVTAGTPVTPDTAFGVVKSVTSRSNAQIEDQGSIGTYSPVFLDEGIQEAGASFEFLPVDDSALLLAVRDGSGHLGSSTIFSGAGPGTYVTGAKLNQLRMTLDAGNRFRCNADWMGLSTVDNAFIAAVIPTGEDFNWIKCVHSLETEIESLEISVNHNCKRRAVIPNASTPFPVSGQKRPAFVVKEGRQVITATYRFFQRPSYSVIADVIDILSTFTLVGTGVVGGSPATFTVTLNNGKPDTKEFTASDAGEANVPMTFKYSTWGVGT